MSSSVRDVMTVIETWAPAGLAYSWDKSGLSIGAPDSPIKRLLVCLTPTRDALNAAKAVRAELVVSHHPLLWDPLTRLRTDDPQTRLCLDFVAAHIACYSAHTNLDLAKGGVNAILAQQLGLEKPRPLLPAKHLSQVKLVTFVPETHLVAVRNAVCAAGAGIIGAYTHCSFSAAGEGTFLPGDETSPFSGVKGTVNEEPERRFEVLVPKARLGAVLDALLRAHPYEEVAYDLVSLENLDTSLGLGIRGELGKPTRLDAFAKRVRKALGLDHVRLIGPAEKIARRVAVLGGSGGSEAASIPDDIDVYVTGDVKYHDAQAALLRGLAVIDAGHAGTEMGIVPVLAAYLRERLPPIGVHTYLEPDLFRLVR